MTQIPVSHNKFFVYSKTMESLLCLIDRLVRSSRAGDVTVVVWFLGVPALAGVVVRCCGNFPSVVLTAAVDTLLCKSEREFERINSFQIFSVWNCFRFFLLMFQIPFVLFFNFFH